MNKLFFTLIFWLGSINSFAVSTNDTSYPFYLGVTAGYGSTTWEGLVPSKEKQNDALNYSTPIEAEEGGGTWGMTAGYQIVPNFAIEANYKRYPNASIHFDKDSIFAFEHEERLFFKTQTETSSLMAKLLLPIPKTNFHAFSSAGIARVHRWDEVMKQWKLTPTFGLGVNYNLSERLFIELGGNYTAGYGEAELSPTDDFMPFLYSATLTLAYRF